MLIHFMDKETEAKNLKNIAQMTQLVRSRVGAQTKVFVSLSSSVRCDTSSTQHSWSVALG